MRTAVSWLAGATRRYVLTARGAEQHAHGVDTVTSWINLALALGLPGRPGSGFGTITGQGNGQGGREHGQKSDQLPGYRSISDPAARAHVAGVWGVDPDSLPWPIGWRRWICWSSPTSCRARRRWPPTSCSPSPSGPRRRAR
jgi:assimilatory nitrate reductase catalytic subunit